MKGLVPAVLVSEPVRTQPRDPESQTYALGHGSVRVRSGPWDRAANCLLLFVAGSQQANFRN